MGNVYLYVVARDFGFAPNPFHGYCTLATCKPRIRSAARVGDWVFGMGGSRLSATGRCVFAMRVTEKVTFDAYWNNPGFIDKRPVRNGSRKMMVGDNIYHIDLVTGDWVQADSHHSNTDGSANLSNLATDTRADAVLISREFFYFGRLAPSVPDGILNDIGYKNRRNHRVFEEAACGVLIEWLGGSFGHSKNQVLADPFDFGRSQMRYSVADDRII